MRVQLEQLTDQLDKEREKTRSKYDIKDLECKSLQVNIDSLKSDLVKSQQELEQSKTRIENLKIKEKENQSNFEKSLRQLEKENEKLSSECARMSSEHAGWERKFETIRCQLSKYEQLIDSLNEQIILVKRDAKECQLKAAHALQTLEVERETNLKLNSKCSQLEKIVQENHQSLAKFQSMDKNYSEIQLKNMQMQSLLNTK